jgi:hypothetical protein
MYLGLHSIESIIHLSMMHRSDAVFVLGTMPFRRPRKEVLKSRALAPQKAKESTWAQ